MRLVTYYEFEQLGELQLHVDYEYEEGQKLIIHPIEDAQEGLAAGTYITSIDIVKGTNRITIDVDEGEWIDELNEQCLAHYEEEAINTRDSIADQQYQEMKDERV